MNRFFWSLVNETFEDIFSINSRFARTISNLTFRPGFVSSEYVKGRKARYVPPLRLYLVTSLILVLFLSVQNSLFSPISTVPVTIELPNEAVSETPDGKQTEVTSDEHVAEAIEAEIDKIKIDFLSDQSTEKLRLRIKEQANKAYHIIKEEPSIFFSILLDTLPPMMFILLPVFALLLKFVYLSSGRFYTEHLVFTLHNQCFVYIVSLVIQILQLVDSALILGPIPGWIIFLLYLWIPLYLLLSLKFFYGQGLVKTLFKFTFLSFAYGGLFLCVFVITLVWGFFTI